MDSERNTLINQFMDMNLGDMEELSTMPLNHLDSMIEELEQAQGSGDLNIETDHGIETLQSIVDKFI